MKAVNAAVKIGVIAAVGDRRDVDLINVGKEAARFFDEIIIKMDEDLRGRSADEIFKLVTTGIKGYSPDKKITFVPDEFEAVETAIRNAPPGAFITILADNITKVVQCVKELQHTEQIQPKDKKPV